MLWKSNAKTRYDATQEELTEGTIFNLKDNKLGICIHKIHYLGDKLFLNCGALNIKDLDLHTEDFEEAVEKSKEILKCKAISIRDSVLAFTDDDEIEFCKY